MVRIWPQALPLPGWMINQGEAPQFVITTLSRNIRKDVEPMPEPSSADDKILNFHEVGN